MGNTTTSNHEADIKNPNKGTDGTNRIYDQSQGNRGTQLNSNHTKPEEKMKKVNN
ncbi:hypothetical protein RHO13_02190 [Orbus wheelerorum]|uniref:hypothetical protein n=1 Tax=Orbus wheelerorum TaxID=3074111 RepID=UPI00370D0F42